MHIIVNVAAHYDWELVKDADFKPTEAQILALDYKPGQDGLWLKKVVVKRDTHTTVSLPEAEIEDCSAHFKRVGSSKTRAQLVAWYLGEKTMPHHAAPEHFTSIEVPDEPDVEKFLNNYFGTGEAQS